MTQIEVSVKYLIEYINDLFANFYVKFDKLNRFCSIFEK